MPSSLPPETTYQARAHGALVGLVVGDCLGSLFGERSTSRTPTQVRRGLWGTEPLRHSGITIQALALANSLVATAAQDDIDQSLVAAELIAAHTRHQDVEYRPTLDALLRQLRAGGDWQALTPRQLGGLGNWGSGAGVRSAPIGIVATSIDAAASMSRRQAQVTHAHPAAVEAAAVAAMAGYLAIRQPPELFLHLRETMAHLRARIDWPPLDDALLRIATLPDHDPRTIACRLGGAQDALSTVAVALAATIGGAGRFEHSLRIALGAGGDARSAAALTGAFAGGLSGYATIPETWMSRCPMTAELGEVAHNLTAQSIERHPSSGVRPHAHGDDGNSSARAR